MSKENVFDRGVFVADAVNATSVTTAIPYTEASKFTGKTIRQVNTIKLANSASSVDNYYVGYSVELTKTLPNGKKYVQEKKIKAYKGANRIAAIEDIWDTGYEPEAGDTYRILLSYKDSRVSINPVMQTLDYVSSDRYGRGLSPEDDFYLESVRVAARKCDAKSDVSIKRVGTTPVFAGVYYEFKEGSRLVWKGLIREDTDTRYVDFTDIIGKLTNKWFSWKSYKVGDLIFNSNKIYKVTSAGTKSSSPTHTSGTTNGMLKLDSLTLNKSDSGDAGPATISVIVNGNPIVKLNEAGEEISGYSLYDADSVDYWRRLGWDEHAQSSATLYQTNFTIDTSVPMFDNINMMLEHYNGIFSYSQGKYFLGIEEAEVNYFPITEEDIIGKISFDDSGSKRAYNSVTVSYSDPANNFESRNISLFSGTYLKQDRNVPKKGNITVTGITNYYNVRLLADSYLKKSRLNLSIRLTLFPEFIELVPGTVVGITYKRYSWINKPFRVDTMTIEEDGLITIVANEYSDDFYSLTNMSKLDVVGSRTPIVGTSVTPPTNLRATNIEEGNYLSNSIQLDWDNADGLPASTQIEIQYSISSLGTSASITNINSNQVTFSAPHELEAGSAIKVTAGGYGLTKNTVYFVKRIVSPTVVVLSATRGGGAVQLTNASGISLGINTFTVLGTAVYPTSSYKHDIPDVKNKKSYYYKVRYKVEK